MQAQMSIPTRYNNHMYRAVDLNSGMEFENEMLPEVMKFVRKRVKVVHGNKLRTYLLENGVAYAEGMDRKGADIYYNFEITIQRW